METVIENLVNQIAHDIRNHAFAVGLQAELGARRAADPTTTREHFEAVLRQVDKLQLYLERLLLYGRPFRPQPSPLDPFDLLREITTQIRHSWPADAPSPSICLETRDEVGRVNWDRRGIHAALRAILDNALHSAPNAPPVFVSIEAAGELVSITVRDEGTGIDPETLARLEVPMACRRPGGAGLGLAIARKMIKAHGGMLEITTSETGTSVRLRLPREAPTG